MDKDLVKILYTSGMNATEIAQDLKVSKASVNKCIQRNFKDLKDLHLKNKKHYNYHKKQVQRAIDYEAKRYMSDKTFILKNRSLYRTKENGDIVLKKELSKNISWDTPRRLSNENKAV